MNVGLQLSTPPADEEGDAFNGACQGRVVFDHLTSRWGVLIIAALQSAPLRFSGLHARIGGISEKMLSQTLRTLVRDGLVERTVTPAAPPQVSYALTPLGDSAAGPLLEVLDWIHAHTTDVVAAQHRHDHHDYAMR
ncbi:helix-turn-helix domain-containing protein [Streptomyces sp. NPDC052496]|uniref:winged helix-turn-helix transcriptional regulator n=1 Tax=Streptomyces sp. NPDC052496 TaxID=3154951 RepID=UPI003441D219